MRPLYGVLVRMHPIEFRSAFGDQMISIFEEMTAECACSASLYLDAVASLARQWLLRSGMLWKAFVSIALTSVAFRVPLKPVRPWVSCGPVPEVPAVDLIAITGITFGIISVILVATISWSRAVHNKRRASCHLSYVRSRSAIAGSRLSRT